MEQAKNYVCRSCSTPVPLSHKFCGRCGAAIPPEILNARTQFFGQLQTPGQGEAHPDPRRGRRGPQLPAQRRAARRRPQRPARLPGRSRSSRRGTRTSSTATASSSCATRGRSTASSGASRAASRSPPGDLFLAGEQLFRIEGSPAARTTARRPTARTSTRRRSTRRSSGSRSSSRAAPSGWRSARGAPSLQIGREGGDLNFPGDLYMSAAHCKLEDARRQAHADGPEQPQRHVRAPQGRARARPTATTSSSGESSCASRSRRADASRRAAAPLDSRARGRRPEPRDLQRRLSCSDSGLAHAEPPGPRGVAVPAAARAQPGRLVPVGPEALERAKREDKPILLSIGYSACHWCHVMERESFENEAIARVMNEWFVSVKVDREERPDLDQVYQLVVQLMGRSGGWPLTVFLTPDQRPFFGGTYFPPVDRYGMPGFPKVLQAVSEAYRARRDEVDRPGRGDDARRSGASRRETSPAAAPSRRTRSRGAAQQARGALRRRARRLRAAPQVPEHDVPRRAPARRGPCRACARRSTRCAPAGIWDHLGGGFHRYSTDERWLVPHFEKMLYDNALLLRLYVDAWRATGERALRGDGARHRRVRRARDDVARGRLLRDAGRRQRGRRGKVLRLDARRGRRGVRRRRRGGARREGRVRRDRRGQLRGQRRHACSRRRAPIEDGRCDGSR